MASQFDKRRPELTRNLLKIYRHATPADIEEGIAWYPNAQNIVRQWASHYRYSVDTVACVTAALSPQLAWDRNLVIADDTLAGRMPSIGGVLHLNLRKAERLRDSDYRTESGATLYQRMTEAFPQGPKVTNFAGNLAGNMDFVTVDTHGIQAALNDPLATVTLKWQPYLAFAECYMRAADKAKRSAAEFQAIVWHTWRRKYPRTWKIQNRKQWHVMGDC